MPVKIGRASDGSGTLVYIPDDERDKFASMWWEVQRALHFGWPGMDEGKLLTIHPPPERTHG